MSEGPKIGPPRARPYEDKSLPHRDLGTPLPPERPPALHPRSTTSRCSACRVLLRRSAPHSLTRAADTHCGHQIDRREKGDARLCYRRVCSSGRITRNARPTRPVSGSATGTGCPVSSDGAPVSLNPGAVEVGNDGLRGGFMRSGATQPTALAGVRFRVSSGTVTASTPNGEGPRVSRRSD